MNENSIKEIINVALELIFCTIFVLCVTYLTLVLQKWTLMFFYILPVICYMGMSPYKEGEDDDE